MITLTIDGIEVEVEKGATILDAAEKAGVRIPTLCHDKRLIPFGSCRMCVVELKGRPGRLTPACFNPARNGMEVITSSPAVVESRKMQLQLLLRTHPLDCPVCEAGGFCDLQDLVYEYGVDSLPFPRVDPGFPVENRSKFIKRDMARCIRCGSCVRICNEVQGVNEISFVNRGIETEIGPDFGRPLYCEFCGQCVSVCPVGALVNKPLDGKAVVRSWEMKRTDTTCSFCALGCRLTLDTAVVRGKEKIIQVESCFDSGSNEGNLCVKGRYGWPYVSSDKRLTRPLVRKGDRLVETSWDEALLEAGTLLRDIKNTSGPDALAVLGGARLTNEEAYALQRFARGVMGAPNLDHGAGAYRPLTHGIASIIGYPGAAGNMKDIREADVILAVCGDFKNTHPVAKNQVILAAGRKNAKVIVLDHVHTSFCNLVGAEALMVPPGTEGLVLRGMMAVILEENLWDESFVSERADGFDELKGALSPYDLKTVSEKTGLEPERIRDAAVAYAKAKTGCILMGLDTLSVGNPVDTAAAAACLAVLTGKIGRAGCGVHIYGRKDQQPGRSGHGPPAVGASRRPVP